MRSGEEVRADGAGEVGASAAGAQVAASEAADGAAVAGEAPQGLLTRRAVLTGAAGIAVLLALGASTRAFASEDFLRPPGGQDFERFFGACIRCDRCRSACDREAITVCTTSDGIANMRVPKLSFRRGFCDLCNGEYKCIAACPTGALVSFDKARDKMGVAVIDSGECLTYNISGRCDARCIDVCDVDALWLDEGGRLQIDQDKCYGCGACEYVCPSNAYGSYSGTGLRGINVWPEAEA